MKKARMPVEGGGEWWIVVHDLTIADGRLRHLRPIHVLTHLAQHYPNVKANNQLFSLSLALENKLFGVRYHQAELMRALAPIGRGIYQHSVQDFAGEQVVLCCLEAYLNSIYTVLEIIGQINRYFHPTLPHGFREQSKKFELFAFEKWPWLSHFYDVRIELTHYNSSLPTIRDRKIFIGFTGPSKLLHFERGNHEIPMDELLGYIHGLFDLADTWAREELKLMPPDNEVDLMTETTLNSRPLSKKIKLREILALIQVEAR